jgi:hypothetical protein
MHLLVLCLHVPTQSVARSQEATNTGIREAGIDVRLCDIGAAIQVCDRHFRCYVCFFVDVCCCAGDDGESRDHTERQDLPNTRE